MMASTSLLGVFGKALGCLLDPSAGQSPKVYPRSRTHYGKVLASNRNTVATANRGGKNKDNMAPILNGEQSAAPAPDGPLYPIVSANCAIVTDGTNPSDYRKLKQLFDDEGANVDCFELQHNSAEASTVLRLVGKRHFPLAFVKGDCIGGLAEASAYARSGFVKAALEQHDFDLVVIGGGSGGLAAGKEAARFGKKVCILDFVVPTPIGTTWGLGGTCVNVGCIPKKLMHQASLLGHCISDAKKFGWKFGDEGKSDVVTGHDWATMKNAIQDHVGSLNWGYRVQLREKSVTYENAFGSFVGQHQLKIVNKRGNERIISADKFLIATGLRPRYVDAPGAKECCITSDDLFSLPYNPGKTLLVGASYVSLECAGFLAGIGLDVTVMVRSILLRGFDQDMAERVGKHMQEVCGVKFIKEAVPTKFEIIEKGTPGRVRVTYSHAGDESNEKTAEFNTVVLAVGRDAVTDSLNLGAANVESNPKNKKIVCVNEQSVTAPNVYAVGDVMDKGLELTPVAIQAGRVLARRLFGGEVALAS